MRRFDLDTSYTSYSQHHFGTRDEKGRFVKKMSKEEYEQKYSILYAIAGTSTRKNMPETLAGKRHPCLAK